MWQKAVSYTHLDVYKRQVLADDLVKMYKNATKFSAKFTDSTGKALVNSDVRLSLIHI